METKTTLLKTSLLALFLFIASTVFADTYYVCENGIFTMSTPPVATDISYTWDVKQGGNSIGAPYPSATAPTSFPTAGTYEIVLISTYTGSDPSICAPDVATNTVIVLPPLTLTLSTPSNPSYCGTVTTPSSVITSTLGSVPSGTGNDLETEFDYTVTKDGASVTIASVGTVDGSGVFTVTTRTPGVYVITGTIKYKQKVGFTNTFIAASAATGCPTTTTQTITVTAPPAAPTITVS